MVFFRPRFVFLLLTLDVSTSLLALSSELDDTGLWSMSGSGETRCPAASPSELFICATGYGSCRGLFSVYAEAFISFSSIWAFSFAPQFFR